MTTTATAAPFGAQMREWRVRRRRSQLDLSVAADVSTRHVSCLETGRARPSPGMIERLCDELDIPLRERNRLHLAAGFAPHHPERAYVELGAVQDAVETVLSGLEPNPALAVDVHWDVVATNRAAQAFLGALPAEPTAGPLNVLRATLHPAGLAPQIRNLTQWREVVLRRVRRQLDRTADPVLAELLQELASYPAPPGHVDTGPHPRGSDLVLPLVLDTPQGTLCFSYALTVFGSPRDVTVDEIAIETFFPADAVTAAALRVDNP